MEKLKKEREAEIAEIKKQNEEIMARIISENRVREFLFEDKKGE